MQNQNQIQNQIIPSQTITLESMKDMSIDDIVNLYRQGRIINLQECTATISADRTSAVEGDFIRLTAIVDPPTSGAIVTFKAASIENFDIGTCDISSGTCYIDWDTSYRSSDQPISVTAVVSGPIDCTSSPIDITLSSSNTPIFVVLGFTVIVASLLRHKSKKLEKEIARLKKNR